MTPEDFETAVAISDALSGRAVIGLDLAPGCDRTVYWCSCGFLCEDIDDLAQHAVEHGIFSAGDP